MHTSSRKNGYKKGHLIKQRNNLRQLAANENKAFISHVHVGGSFYHFNMLQVDLKYSAPSWGSPNATSPSCLLSALLHLAWSHSALLIMASWFKEQGKTHKLDSLIRGDFFKYTNQSNSSLALNLDLSREVSWAEGEGGRSKFTPLYLVISPLRTYGYETECGKLVPMSVEELLPGTQHYLFLSSQHAMFFIYLSAA